MKYREMRYPCDCPAEVSDGSVTVPVTVLNISSNGARVGLIDHLVRGDRVKLRVAGDCVSADVRWERGAMAGLRFSRPISPRFISAIRRSTGSRSAITGWNLKLREID